MKQNEFNNHLISHLQKTDNRPLSTSEIATALKLKQKDRKQLQKWLRLLVNEGTLARVRHGRYVLPAPADLVTGSLSVVRSGNGFVAPTTGGADVFVPARRLRTALPGDTVLVRLEPAHVVQDRPGPAGEIVRVVERKRRDIVGTLKRTGSFLCVVPIDPAYNKDFYVSSPGKAKVNDRVVARFKAWDNRHVNPEAEIIDVIGSADLPSLDTESVIRQFALRDEFSPAVLREAESASTLADEPGKRLDLRDRVILTIDPATAKDYDDALSLETDGDGNRVLGVHIADVSHYVRPGSEMDKEACVRGNSVYLPDKVLPMLPEQLSNVTCSLQSDQDRLAFSVFMTVDSVGTVISRRFERTLIRSRARLTYDRAADCIAGKKVPSMRKDVAALLRRLHKLASQIREHRFAHGALALDVPECEITVGPNGAMTGYTLVESDPAHQLVEEFMVSANEAVAVELAGRGIQCILRAHEAPDPERLESLAAQLEDMGLSPGDLSKRANLAALLKSVEGNPLEHAVRIAVLKSLKRAEYAAAPLGHFGLAKAAYAHFTSPIRRYPDLVVHRQLAAALRKGKGRSYAKKTLSNIARNSSRTERTADEAEKTLSQIMKYRFLAKQVEDGKAQQYDAVVVNVQNFGMFVELPDLGIQGLVHVSAVSEGFVRYNRKRDTLTAGKEEYGVGRRLVVQPCKVDLDARRIDFVLG